VMCVEGSRRSAARCRPGTCRWPGLPWPGAIRYAEAHDLVGRNVATLVDNPAGQIGRPSRSFTLAQSLALLEAARESRLNAYVVLSLATGIRTEEARELHWEHVDLDGDPGATRPVPPSVAVWHSVRQGGDTKTAKSRRTLALPQAAVQTLREHRKRQLRTSWQPEPCGRITTWSSPRPSAPRWTRPTSAASSARSLKRPGSAPAGRRGTCATPSFP
jgi:integrase